MSYTGKVWGSTQVLLQTPLIEIHKLQIRPNSYCSKHLHQFKHNFFYVTSGTLTISVSKKSYDLTDVTVLGPGMFTTVPPNELHWFSSGDEPVEAIEGYYLEPLSADIVRKSVGGVEHNSSDIAQQKSSDAVSMKASKK